MVSTLVYLGFFSRVRVLWFSCCDFLGFRHLKIRRAWMLEQTSSLETLTL